MESNVIIGISILLFTYGLFSWALGRFINKRNQKETNEFQNFLSGGWIIGLILLFFIAWSYFR